MQSYPDRPFGHELMMVVSSKRRHSVEKKKILNAINTTLFY